MSSDRGRPKLPPKHPVGTKNPFIGGSRQVHMSIGKPKSTLAKYNSFFDRAKRIFVRNIFGYGGHKPHQGQKECERRAEQIKSGKILNWRPV